MEISYICNYLFEFLKWLLPTLVSSFIFLLIISIPKFFRNKKLKLIANEKISAIHLDLLHYIDTAFYHSPNPVSVFKGEIHSGNLTCNDFQNALKKKSLSQNQELLFIGDFLKQRTSTLQYKIDYITHYSDNGVLLLYPK